MHPPHHHPLAMHPPRPLRHSLATHPPHRQASPPHPPLPPTPPLRPPTPPPPSLCCVSTPCQPTCSSRSSHPRFSPSPAHHRCVRPLSRSNALQMCASIPLWIALLSRCGRVHAHPRLWKSWPSQKRPGLCFARWETVPALQQRVWGGSFSPSVGLQRPRYPSTEPIEVGRWGGAPEGEGTSHLHTPASGHAYALPHHPRGPRTGRQPATVVLQAGRRARQPRAQSC